MNDINYNNKSENKAFKKNKLKSNWKTLTNL